MLKTIRKHGITLALFAAGSTGLTAAINLVTKSTIAEQAVLQQKALFDQVLPADRYNNTLQDSCFLVNAPALGKVRTASISPVRTISPSPPFLKPRRRTAILAPYSSWLALISAAQC